MTLVDTNVLIDISTNDRTWLAWASRVMDERSSVGPLLINEIIYAEFAAGFETKDQLDTIVDSMGLVFQQTPKDALFAASRVFLDYRRSGGTRTSILSDFFIGAHADVAGLTILTRDIRRYRSHFPNVALIAPNLGL